jgi:hypothetical protein
MRNALICLIVIVICGGCRQNSTPSRSSHAATTPASRLAYVHLQDGFDGKPLVVTYEGRQVYSGKPKTNELVGLAVAFEFDRGESASGILVLRFGESSYQRKIDWASGRFIGLSINHDHLRVLQNENGFGYV